MYSEKATKFCEISTNYLSYVHTASQRIGGDFAKFCGLLRIYELYENYPETFSKELCSKALRCTFFGE